MSGVELSGVEMSGVELSGVEMSNPRLWFTLTHNNTTYSSVKIFLIRYYTFVIVFKRECTMNYAITSISILQLSMHDLDIRKDEASEL